MSVDPRAPVLVGVGQVSEHDEGADPVRLIARAAAAAAADAGCPELLRRLDSIRLCRSLSWRGPNLSLAVAHEIGATPRHTGSTGHGGNGPQTLLNGAAEDVAAGRADVILVGGGESWRTRSRIRARGERHPWTWTDDSIPEPEILVPDVQMNTAAQQRLGLTLPLHVYPLFEQPIRVAAGRSIAEHHATLCELWSRFSAVASRNPHAWSRRQYSAAELDSPQGGNRWISWPYRKLLNSNNMVDQAAVLLLCSVDVARSLRIPQDRWVFPHSGAEARDTADIGARARLDGSAALRIAATRAMQLARTHIDDVAHIDIYSCFPSAVQIAAGEIGLALDDAARPLTVTGGLSFAGGPWNNYSSHAIATMVLRLRDAPGERGLVTANGGYLTKHSVGVYSTEPPSAGFRRVDVQPEVDKLPTVPSIPEYVGPGVIESWTVAHDREGRPERGFLSLRTDTGNDTGAGLGARTLAAVRSADSLALLEFDDVVGRVVQVSESGKVAAL